MSSRIRSTRYGKNGFEATRSNASRLVIKTSRSPRGAKAPRFGPKLSVSSGFIPYKASFIGNGSATCDSEYTPGG